MAKFTITINEFDNNPPFSTGKQTINIDNRVEYVFTKNDFINTSPPYQDPENDDLLAIKIVTLLSENIGSLEYNSIPVVLNQEITVADIENGLFKYISENQDQQYDDLFGFDVADEGSTQFGGLEGTVFLNIEGVENLPPTIGDGESTIDYSESLVFTRAMFTTQTTPPYSDPEGDAALKLQIINLPDDGVLKLNGVNVFTNQIILFDEIDNGNLVYIPDNNITQSDMETFNFAIADAGSNIFVQ